MSVLKDRKHRVPCPVGRKRKEGDRAQWQAQMLVPRVLAKRESLLKYTRTREPENHLAAG